MGEKDEKSTAKRGRPKKKDEEEIISEETNQLNMATKEQSKVTLNQVRESLTAFYTKCLPASGNTFQNFQDLQRWNPFLQNQRLKNISIQPSELDRDTLINSLK